MSKQVGPRVLIYDIETSLQPVAVFSLVHNDYIDHKNILAERHIVTVAWKWLGESKVHSVSLLDDSTRFNRDAHDDTYVCKEFHKVLSEADIIVAHNGDSFDYRYIQTRLLVHKLPVLPPIQSYDTYKIAKQQFMLNSNRLDYIGKLLGLGGKKQTPQGLWLDVLAGSRKAIKVMEEYNKRDVTLLEDVFKRLIPYMPNHVNRELFGGKGCPRCGSTKVQSRGTHKAISRVYQRFQCQACGGWFKDAKPTKVSAKYRIL